VGGQLARGFAHQDRRAARVLSHRVAVLRCRFRLRFYATFYAKKRPMTGIIGSPMSTVVSWKPMGAYHNCRRNRMLQRPSRPARGSAVLKRVWVHGQAAPFGSRRP